MDTLKKAPRPIITEPSLVVCREKHGEFYFLVKEDEDVFRIALSILRGRLKTGWYPAPGPKPADLDFTEEDVQKLPKTFQPDAWRKFSVHKNELNWWLQETKNHGDIKQALAENDGRLAWQILKDRSDGEYENVGIERLLTKYGS